MIAVFEGPQGAGKTSIIERLMDEFKHREVPAARWKVERGTSPILDMNSTLGSNAWTDDKVYMLDRFHLSEWVISRASRRNWASEAEWKSYETELIEIDRRLQKLGALVIFVSASPKLIQHRLDKLNKKDILGGAQQADYHWRLGMAYTRCDMLHLLNNDTTQMRRNVLLLADLLESRWAHKTTPSTLDLLQSDIGGLWRE